MIDIIPPKIIGYPEDLRSCIREDYPEEPGDLPIRGGWGYSPEDAIVVDTNDPAMTDENMIYRADDIPDLLIELRIYYELVNMRPANDRYAGIKWKVSGKEMVSKEGKQYQRFLVEITAHKASDYEALKTAYDRGRLDSEWNKEEHFAMHEELMRRYVGEYWFEI